MLKFPVSNIWRNHLPFNHVAVSEGALFNISSLKKHEENMVFFNVENSIKREENMIFFFFKS